MDDGILLLLLLGGYFLPAIIGGARHKRNATAIFALNLLLGWTVIGWIIALIWSVAYEDPKESQVRRSEPNVTESRGDRRES